jgi:hypothetical protein
MGVSVKGLCLRRRFERGQLLGAENWLIDLAGRQSFANELDSIAHRDGDDDLDGFREERPSDDHMGFELVDVHAGTSLSI